jgi:hypothetical protein
MQAPIVRILLKFHLALAALSDRNWRGLQLANFSEGIIAFLKTFLIQSEATSLGIFVS